MVAEPATYVMRAGSRTWRSTTLAALLGPLFLIEVVYTTGTPTRTGSGARAIAVTATSVIGTTVALTAELLLAVLLSIASGLDTVAVLSKAPSLSGRLSVMVTVRDAPAANSFTVQVTVEPKTQLSPVPAPASTTVPVVVPPLPLYQCGKASTTLTVGARSGPALLTVSV